MEKITGIQWSELLPGLHIEAELLSTKTFWFHKLLQPLVLSIAVLYVTFFSCSCSSWLFLPSLFVQFWLVQSPIGQLVFLSVSVSFQTIMSNARLDRSKPDEKGHKVVKSCSIQLNLSEFSSIQLNSAKFCSIQLNSAQFSSIQLSSAQFSSILLNSSKFSST